MKEPDYLRNMFNSGNKYAFECTDCGTHYLPGEVEYLCPACSMNASQDQPPKGVLKTLYDYEALRKHNMDLNTLEKEAFLSLLPLKSLDHWPGLRIGKTPLYHVNESRGSEDFDLFIKDDSQNPSYSFKDRASGLISAFAKENGIETIITASTGNAGSSIACIAASQGQKAIVLVPETAPIAKLIQIRMYGAVIIPVKGSYDDAFELSKQASEYFGWYNRNTAYNPLTIEGKKTVSFELVRQFKGIVPDNIFVPVGDGVIISGLYKGFEDLLKLGLIDRMPGIIGIQAKKSDNLARNIKQESFTINSVGSIADSITVNVPRNFFMTQKFNNKYSGTLITVSDESIIHASHVLASKYGLFAEPAAAASMAGLLHYKENGKINSGSRNVVLLTGSGLKDLSAVEKSIPIPDAIEADLNRLKKYLHDQIQSER